MVLRSIKALDFVDVAQPGLKDRNITLMSTASSDGNIFVYNLSQIPIGSSTSDDIPVFKPIASYNTKGSRLVCLTMADGSPTITSSTLQVKRKAQ